MESLKDRATRTVSWSTRKEERKKDNFDYEDGNKR